MERSVRKLLDVVVVATCVTFVFANLHPFEILSPVVPAGGDMGAHVWGPAYLRDHLLPNLRLSGWTPDWYAGFPAYQFYMVVPSLAIVALDVGLLGGWLVVIPLVLAALAVVAAVRAGAGRRRWAWVAAAVGIVVVGAELPYGTAFKLVTVSGVLTMPVAAYAFGRLTQVPFPGPALLAVGTVPFLWDRNFHIYGGNVASTMAGEFAFSMSLSVALVYLGVVDLGLRTGRHRALAAVLLALCGLCHIIPAFFALVGTVVLALLRRPRWRTPRWLVSVLPVAGLLAAFWVLPFVWRRAYVNDMGWEKLPHDGETIWRYLIPRHPQLPVDLRWTVVLAAVGLILCLLFRVRAGLFLAAMVVVSSVAFVTVPQGRLWNARLLPFHYLCLYLLAALAVSELGRTVAVLVARDPERPGLAAPVVAAGLALVAVMVYVGLPLRTLPLGQQHADGSYTFLGLENGPDDRSFVRSWARHNYTGYEGKPAYGEYRDLVTTMADIGRTRGCGRAMWEYDKAVLERYGTPMSLMLLPHWTDGCIGSMEGLFFESSATTPFHFLTQVELSSSPSAAQRALPYAGFDFDKGIDHLQMLGVRYYLATSVGATTAARAHPDLTELATSGPWAIFEVADSPLVEALDHQPAVMEGADQGRGWICATLDAEERCEGPAVDWFTDPTAWDAFLAASGPPEWERVPADDPQPSRMAVPPTEVSDVEVGRDRISFTVDEPGRPVLVKASYFPNWQASGADGPYRVAPNLMVVVPTDTTVTLTFGRTPVDWIAYGLTALGLVGLVLLRRWDRT